MWTTHACPDVASIPFAVASTALTKLQDFEFYGKRMRTAYSKSKSDAVAKEEGTFVPKNKRKAGEGNSIVSKHQKKAATGAAAGAGAAAAAASGAAPAAPAAAPVAASAAAPAAAAAPVSGISSIWIQSLHLFVSIFGVIC